MGDATEVLDDPVIVSGQGADRAEDLLEGAGIDHLLGRGVRLVQDRKDDVAELLALGRAQGTANCLDDVHGALARISE